MIDIKELGLNKLIEDCLKCSKEEEHKVNPPEDCGIKSNLHFKHCYCRYKLELAGKYDLGVTWFYEIRCPHCGNEQTEIRNK